MTSSMSADKQQSPCLHLLPIELQSEIIALLVQKDDETSPIFNPHVRNLCSTCSWFRTLLAPSFFERIYLMNTEKSARSVKAIAEGKWSGHVKEIEYVGICEENQRESPIHSPIHSPIGATIEEVYPPEVDDVLSNLTLFRNLEKITVDFPFDYEDGLEIQDEFETDPEIIAACESEDRWRGLMAKSFHAIARNSPHPENPGQLSSLTIRDLDVAAVSTFTTQPFHDFLSRLKNFDLSLTRCDNAIGWNVSAFFLGFSDCFGPWFFNHLPLVEELSFDPRPSSMLGEQYSFGSHNLGLNVARMPMLRMLKLDNIFICQELITFVAGHLETLESITLTDCCACAEGGPMDIPPIHWNELFDQITKRNPTQLASFEIICTFSESRDIFDLNDEWSTSSSDVLEQVKEKLAQGFKPFAYAGLDEKYGFRSHDAEQNQTALLEGDDERSYRSLMALVERNVKKAEGT